MSANKTARKNRYKGRQRSSNFEFSALARQWLKSVLGFSGFCMMGIFFIFIYDALIQCEYFRAEAIAVYGENRLSEKAVLDTAGLEAGVNILSVNLPMVQKRLVAAPWIRSAGVRREFPSRLSLSVEEHEPMAVLDVGRLFLINTAGTIFKEAEPTEMTGLPVISGVGYADWKRPDGSETKVFKAVMTILEIIGGPDSPLSGRDVHGIAVDPEIGLTVRISKPDIGIELGYGDYEQKLRRIRRILAHIQEAPQIPAVELLDAHNPRRIIAIPADRNMSQENKEV